MSRHLGADNTEIDATILFVLQILSDNFRLAHCEYTGLSEPMGRGDIATSELADQFTQGLLLEIPTREGADYAHNITTCPPPQVLPNGVWRFRGPTKCFKNPGF